MNLLGRTHHDLKLKLETYLESDDRFRAVYDYTNKRFAEASNLTAHNWEHVYRDIMNAIVIGESEAAAMSIVLPAVTMHDIGFLFGASGKTHAAVGAEKLDEFLKRGRITAYPEAEIKGIADCIRTHKGSMHNEHPKSREAKVVADADLLDKFGPVGVYQHIRTFTEFNQSLVVTLERQRDIYKLTLETDTGRRLAEQGRAYVAQFFNDLYDSSVPYVG